MQKFQSAIQLKIPVHYIEHMNAAIREAEAAVLGIVQPAHPARAARLRGAGP
jgi:hypothetical protein